MNHHEKRELRRIEDKLDELNTKFDVLFAMFTELLAVEDDEEEPSAEDLSQVEVEIEDVPTEPVPDLPLVYEPAPYVDPYVEADAAAQVDEDAAAEVLEPAPEPPVEAVEEPVVSPRTQAEMEAGAATVEAATEAEVVEVTPEVTPAEPEPITIESDVPGQPSTVYPDGVMPEGGNSPEDLGQPAGGAPSTADYSYPSTDTQPQPEYPDGKPEETKDA